ncbi:hypothetical protein HUW51_23215 [Adhaeribacter swui]|uniref:YCII-related domain-containing protein n=1 Tax=Adhaeribacter swui TaxID=2086471 RepID=A0A7G7GE91_9BACT|nr:YciI family protein [Adhaeribacter swui]QNF35475.1 hypothetical protein HUW51_23215 [Adhaeribacter swui]
MEKKYFLLKLTPSRNDFAQTMTDEEKSIMQQHVQYGQQFLANGKMLVFGPVLDPAATYGVAILAVSDENEVIEFIQNDPASKINQYAYFRMLAMVAPNELNRSI